MENNRHTKPNELKLLLMLMLKFWRCVCLSFSVFAIWMTKFFWLQIKTRVLLIVLMWARRQGQHQRVKTEEKNYNNKGINRFHEHSE